MEWRSCTSMVFQGELTASGLCSYGWKTGGSSRWNLWKLHRKMHTGISLKFCRREVKAQSMPVKSALSISGAVFISSWTNSSGRHAPFTHSRFIAKDVRWLEIGSLFISSDRPSTAIEAGRSKAKQGQTSGGRIEKRFVTTRRPKPSNPAEFQEGTHGVNQRELQGRDTAGGNIEGRGNGGRLEEDELNSTWQELGLGDRRSKGKFLPDTGAPVKEATRVGGWGRDKSMQRVITPEEQRASRGGKRERTRSGVRQKPQTPVGSAVKKKKKKWDADFDPDPSIIHPPEYYKYGPYGPHVWKGRVVGKVVEGTWSTNQVVYFSNVKDEAEAEDRKMANVAVDYTDTVATFDVSVGIQYFYAFARRRFGPRPDPWQDWTLVAQIAIGSGSDLGEQGDVFLKMGSKAQDITSQCVAWARPDLTYVKKPKFQLRLESQEKFLIELFNLLDPTKYGNDSTSYYGTLCRLVGVDVDASATRVRNAYEALDEPGKLECLKHVFTNHPVEILSRSRYDRQYMEHRGELLVEDGSADFPPGEEIDDESLNSVDDEEENHLGSGPDDHFAGSMEISGIDKAEAGSTEQQGRPNNSDSNPRRRPGRPKKRLYYAPAVRSAVRPYSYVNVIEEIAEIRSYLSKKRAMISVS